MRKLTWVLALICLWAALQRSVEANDFDLPPIDQLEDVLVEGPISSQPVPSAAMPKIEGFVLDGNSDSAFTDADLQAVLDEFKGKDLSGDHLESARVALTMHYVKAGYINSGAVLPDQEIVNGLVKFEIIEGELDDIQIEGARWLREAFIEKRLRRAMREDGPFKMDAMKDPLRLLHRHPVIQRLNTEVKPGAEPGKSYLQVQVAEERPFDMGIDIHNTRPASVGEEQIDLWFTHHSLTRNGDSLSLRYGLLDDGIDDLSISEFDNFSVSYALPVNARNTTLIASYSRNSYAIIEEPFANIDVDGESSSFRFGLRHPIFETADQELALGLYFDRSISETRVLGEPFSISAGSVNGRTEADVLRFTQEYTKRRSQDVLSLRSTFSLGVNLFGETDNGTDRDSEFVSWRLQGQYVRKLFDSDAQMILRGGLQVSDDPLLSSEQFSLGGMNSVRGYRENQLVRDMGYSASLEVQFPIIPNKDKGNLLTLAPFLDIGGGWKHEVKEEFNASNEHEMIVSAGLGVIVEPNEHLTAELYWGHAFTEFDNPNDSLQDNGIHFRLGLRY